MSPEFKNGDYVLVLNKKITSPHRGDTILFHDDVHGKLLKKWVKKIDGKIFVKGVHPYSTDSTTLGTIPMSKVFGKVIYSFSI